MKFNQIITIKLYLYSITKFITLTYINISDYRIIDNRDIHTFF